MPVSIPVKRFSMLKKGDHIKWKRRKGIDHHAIVEYVDDDNHAVLVIEYIKSKVIERWVREIKEMYKYIYYKCDDAQKVVERALSRLGERAYNLFTNNCEHFATWCKTGRQRCSQIQPLKARAVTSTVAGGSGGAATVASRCIASCISFACENGTTIAYEIKTLVTCGGPKNVLKGVGNAIVNGGKKIGFNGLKSGCSAAITGALIVVSEACLFGYNCYKAQRNYKAAIKLAENDEMKEYCKEHRNWNIAEAGFESVGGIAGAAAGAAIGSFVPVIGTAIGAVVGNVVGRILGKFCGRCVRWRFG